jgi:hypothetical protein
MAKRGAWETVKLQGEQIVDEVRKLIREGNVRRVVVKQKGDVVAEFPLTVGVVASVAAPVLAAIGALVALLTDCSIDLERRRPVGKPKKKAVRKTAKKAARKAARKAKKPDAS